MDQKEFMNNMQFGEGIDNTPLEEALRQRYFISGKNLQPSTTPANIKHNIKILEELLRDLRAICTEHNSHLPLTYINEFVKAYKESSTLYEPEEEISDVSEPFLRSLKIKHKKNCIIRIKTNLNYKQSRVISKFLYEKSEAHPLVFPISNADKFDGKVIGEIEQRKIKIPVAWIVKISLKDDEKYISYIFGEELPKRGKVVEELSGEFYLYRFLSKQNNEYAVISHEQLKLDDYTIEGLVIDLPDAKILGDASKILSKYPILFVHSTTSHVCKFETHDQLFEKVDQIKLTGNKLFNYVLSHKKNGKIQILEHPRWFLKFVLSFLLHKAKGATTEYPLHFLWIAERGTGKTTFLEALHQKSGEALDIVAGSTSTLKYLIPSFKETNKPEMGALAKASRYIFVDEFFRILRVNRNEKEDQCGKMNDLLEHKERQAGSGQGNIRTSMTARLIAATNPIAGTKEIVSLVDKFDDSFLSRFIIYYQTADHIRFVHKQMKENVHTTTEWINVSDFLSIQDYLHKFDAEYDRARIIEMFEKFLPFLGDEIKGMYEGRYLHHLECLIDGLIKTRCLITRDKSFKAIEEDYKEAESIWATIIKSWFGSELDEVVKDSGKYDFETRYKFLPEEARYVLRVLKKQFNCRSNTNQLKEACRKEVKRPDLIDFMLNLLWNGKFIIQRENGELLHYEWDEREVAE